ncbi:thiamine pyrophosphate-requiring protein [Sulfitobacter sp. AS92]|uniref:thiamine pyrophosphate-requiring protein n=1 Tax=Sulfitobacter sp. AS92 TaxID=3135783 RepID=UPI003174E5D6
MTNMVSAGEALLRSLKSNGVDYLFINPGSDFAPIIEAFAKVNSNEIPQAVPAAHENVVVSMAHGYYLATGHMAAAAVHVNVGLANAAMGLLNAHSDDVPIFMISGRNPLTESQRMGSRHTPIQYGQEMFDQTGIVREAVKWDYELRYGENAADLVSRGCSIARMEPVGAVYMSLPREPLCEETEMPGVPCQVAPAASYPNPEAIKQAAKALADAKNPLIICSRGDAAGEVSAELQAIAHDNSIAVTEVFVTRNVLPTDFENSVGGNIVAHLPDADVVLVVDAAVAWIESKASPAPDAEVIHLGPDPMFTRIPVRGFKTTQAIQCNTVAGLRALRKALPGKSNLDRQQQISGRHARFRDAISAKVEQGRLGLANKPWIAKCISDILGDGTVFAERGGPLPLFNVKGSNQWFGNTQAGGLGWGLPAALGYQLANRDRLTVCVVGDGSYMFANPIACHQVAQAQNLPILTIVLNNGSWDAVRISTLDIYPNGDASKANHVPMVPFMPTPAYGNIAAASGCYAETIENAEDLPTALERAMKVIRNERRQVLLDVKVGMDDGEK